LFLDNLNFTGVAMKHFTRLLPSLYLKARLLPVLAALSLAGAALAPSSAPAQPPQTEDFQEVYQVPQVWFEYAGMEDGAETLFANPQAATLRPGMSFKLIPFFNFPSSNLYDNVSSGLGDAPSDLNGSPPSGLARFQPNMNLYSGDNFRVWLDYDGAGTMSAAFERTNVEPIHPAGMPHVAIGTLPVDFIWGNFNLRATPGEQNPNIPYPINMALLVTPSFAWNQPFQGSFDMGSRGFNSTINGVSINQIFFNNALFFDVNAPDALPMDKIIFADHDYIQPVGMVDGEYQVNFTLDGVERPTDNPLEELDVVFTEDNVLFSLSPHLLTGGQLRFRVELDPRLTASGPMEFAAFVAGGPTAALNWDQYSDAAPARGIGVGAPRAVQVAAAVAGQQQRGQ
jgi:hypothetical protein